MDAKEIADTLERYQALLDSGALSQEEFDALKAKLLLDATAHDEASKERDDPQEVGADAEAASTQEELPPLEVVMSRVEKGDIATTTAKIKDPLTNEEWKYPKNYSTKLSEHPKVGYHALANMIEQDTGRIVKRHSSWERDDRPVEVFFEWGENRHLDARLRLPEASEEIRYGKHFVFPKNTNPKEFCQGVAGDIERDLGKPVRWHAPEGKADVSTAKIIGIVFGSVAALLVVALVVGSILPPLLSKSGSSSSRKTTTTTRNIDTSYDSVDAYLNAKEFETLKTNIKVAGSDLNKIVANGDTSELKLRRSLVWSALREFEALSVPSKCKSMRDYYIYASEDLVSALDYYYDYFAKSKNSGTLDNANACIEEATKYLNIAMDKEDDLKR